MNLAIPEGSAICPCCDGTKTGCMNCGGQMMFGTPKGYTKIDPTTQLGCKHDFKGIQAGRCYTKYTCTICCTCYDIDSGD